MNQGAEKHITKEDIGYPTNFMHTYHVGPGDTINMEEDNPFQVVVTNTVRSTDQSDEEREEEDGNDKENEKKINKCDIGQPTDFRHSVHISFSESGSVNIETDNEKLSEFLRKSGVSETHLQESDVPEFIFEFIERQLEREEIKGNPKYEFLKNFQTYLLENRMKQEEPTTSEESGRFNETAVQEKDEEPEKNNAEKTITKEEIGYPTDFQHVTHISCNENDGFIIETNDETLSEFFKKAGVTDTDLQDKNTLEFILDYIDKHLQKEKEETSNKEFLKNLKEYLLHFKAKNSTLTRRHKKKKKERESKFEEDVSGTTNEQRRENDTKVMQNAILKTDEVETNEDRGG